MGEVFREAIRASSAAMIVVHNHPSGDPTPSPEDVQVTRQIVEAGSLLNIDVLDHLIIGRQRFVSMKERGLGFRARSHSRMVGTSHPCPDSSARRLRLTPCRHLPRAFSAPTWP